MRHLELASARSRGYYPSYIVLWVVLSRPSVLNSCAPLPPIPRFDHVFLVSNECADNDFMATRRAVARAPVPPSFVDLIEDERCRSAEHHFQPTVYNRVVLRQQETWIKDWAARHPNSVNPFARTAFIDLDEYVTVGGGHASIQAALLAEGGASASWSAPQWTLLWRTFGTGGQSVRPRLGTVLSAFLKAAPDCVLDPLSAPEYLRGCNNNYSMATHNARLGPVPVSIPHLEKAMCDASWLVGSGGYQGSLPHNCAGDHFTSGSLLRDGAVVLNSSRIWFEGLTGDTDTRARTHTHSRLSLSRLSPSLSLPRARASWDRGPWIEGCWRFYHCPARV